MSLGTDLLELRRNKTSTVATLLSGMERLATARSETTLMTRAFAQGWTDPRAMIAAGLVTQSLRNPTTATLPLPHMSPW